MSGTKKGSENTGKINKAKHGEDFYAKIGAKGGSTRTTKTKLRGFGGNRDLARRAGRIGGMAPRGEAKYIQTPSYLDKVVG